MKDQEKIYDLHTELIEWSNKLKFYKDEIGIMKGRLEEVASKNTDKELLKQVEHFQNQFIVQRNNIDEIAHQVKINEEKLITEIKNNPVAVDRRKLDDHKKERDLVNGFENNFNGIRTEFKEFAAKWM